ncbi:MAG TPA: phycobilisome protein [Cyanothece sp. UBA12306]|nr:phycobilisome protein [Cyanothece sp. UBA12306]
MQIDFDNVFYQAEDHYLQASEINLLKDQITVLGKRLETYKWLRDQEIAIFQPIADQLLMDFPEQNPQVIELAIKHWLGVMRYGAMAMLLNNPEYFRHRVLEWLTDMIDAHEMVSIEQRLYELLESNLENELESDKFDLLKPFLTQAQTTLLENKNTFENLIVGEKS